MDHGRALELYAQFLTNYEDKRLKVVVEGPILPYDPGVTSLAAHTIADAGEDFLREISNSINDLRRWINTVAAWKPVYEICEMDEQLHLLVQHITPVATLALSAPQALRGRIMYAAASCSAIANHELHRENPKLHLLPDHVNMTSASKLGAPWGAWPALAQRMNEISTTVWSLSTTDFRNAREHGHPRNIGIGITNIFKIKQVDGRRQIASGFREPIPLQTVIDTGIEGHTAVVAAYHALAALIEEQTQALIEDAKKKNPYGIQFFPGVR